MTSPDPDQAVINPIERIPLGNEHVPPENARQSQKQDRWLDDHADEQNHADDSRLKLQGVIQNATRLCGRGLEPLLPDEIDLSLHHLPEDRIWHRNHVTDAAEWV